MAFDLSTYASQNPDLAGKSMQEVAQHAFDSHDLGGRFGFKDVGEWLDDPANAHNKQLIQSTPTPAAANMQAQIDAAPSRGPVGDFTAGLTRGAMRLPSRVFGSLAGAADYVLPDDLGVKSKVSDEIYTPASSFRYVAKKLDPTGIVPLSKEAITGENKLSNALGESVGTIGSDFAAGGALGLFMKGAGAATRVGEGVHTYMTKVMPAVVGLEQSSNTREQSLDAGMSLDDAKSNALSSGLLAGGAAHLMGKLSMGGSGGLNGLTRTAIKEGVPTTDISGLFQNTIGTAAKDFGLHFGSFGATSIGARWAQSELAHKQGLSPITGAEAVKEELGHDVIFSGIMSLMPTVSSAFARSGKMNVLSSGKADPVARQSIANEVEMTLVKSGNAEAAPLWRSVMNDAIEKGNDLALKPASSSVGGTSSAAASNVTTSPALQRFIDGGEVEAPPADPNSGPLISKPLTQPGKVHDISDPNIDTVTGKSVVTPPETISDVDAIATFRTNLGAKYGKEFAEDSLVAVAPSSPFHHAAASVANLFGKRIVFFESNLPDHHVAGAVDQSVPNTIFLNANSVKPHMAVVGHELLHTLRADHTDLYQSVSDALSGFSKEQGEYVDKITGVYKKKGATISADKATEEFHADAMFQAFSSEEFWNQFQAKNPTHFSRVVSYVSKFLDAVVSKFKGEVTPEMQDVINARKSLGDIMAKYAERQQGGGDPNGLQWKAKTETASEIGKVPTASQGGVGNELAYHTAEAQNPNVSEAQRQFHQKKIIDLSNPAAAVAAADKASANPVGPSPELQAQITAKQEQIAKATRGKRATKALKAELADLESQISLSLDDEKAPARGVTPISTSRRSGYFNEMSADSRGAAHRDDSLGLRHFGDVKKSDKSALGIEGDAKELSARVHVARDQAKYAEDIAARAEARANNAAVSGLSAEEVYSLRQTAEKAIGVAEQARAIENEASKQFALVNKRDNVAREDAMSPDKLKSTDYSEKAAPIQGPPKPFASEEGGTVRTDTVAPSPLKGPGEAPEAPSAKGLKKLDVTIAQADKVIERAEAKLRAADLSRLGPDAVEKIKAQVESAHAARAELEARRSAVGKEHASQVEKYNSDLAAHKEKVANHPSDPRSPRTVEAVVGGEDVFANNPRKNPQNVVGNKDGFKGNSETAPPEKTAHVQNMGKDPDFTKTPIQRKKLENIDPTVPRTYTVKNDDGSVSTHKVRYEQLGNAYADKETGVDKRAEMKSAAYDKIVEDPANRGGVNLVSPEVIATVRKKLDPVGSDAMAHRNLLVEKSAAGKELVKAQDALSRVAKLTKEWSRHEGLLAKNREKVAALKAAGQEIPKSILNDIQKSESKIAEYRSVYQGRDFSDLAEVQQKAQTAFNKARNANLLIQSDVTRADRNFKNSGFYFPESATNGTLNPGGKGVVKVATADPHSKDGSNPPTTLRVYRSRKPGASYETFIADPKKSGGGFTPETLAVAKENIAREEADTLADRKARADARDAGLPDMTEGVIGKEDASGLTMEDRLSGDKPWGDKHDADLTRLEKDLRVETSKAKPDQRKIESIRREIEHVTDQFVEQAKWENQFGRRTSVGKDAPRDPSGSLEPPAEGEKASPAFKKRVVDAARREPELIKQIADLKSRDGDPALIKDLTDKLNSWRDFRASKPGLVEAILRESDSFEGNHTVLPFERSGGSEHRAKLEEVNSKTSEELGRIQARTAEIQEKLKIEKDEVARSSLRGELKALNEERARVAAEDPTRAPRVGDAPEESSKVGPDPIKEPLANLEHRDPSKIGEGIPEIREELTKERDDVTRYSGDKTEVIDETEGARRTSDELDGTQEVVSPTADEGGDLTADSYTGYALLHDDAVQWKHFPDGSRKLVDYLGTKEGAISLLRYWSTRGADFDGKLLIPSERAKLFDRYPDLRDKFPRFSPRESDTPFAKGFLGITYKGLNSAIRTATRIFSDLGDRVTSSLHFVKTFDDLSPGVRARLSADGISADHVKAFYDKTLDKTIIIADRHSSVTDIIQSVLHEAGHGAEKIVLGAKADRFFSDVSVTFHKEVQAYLKDHGRADNATNRLTAAREVFSDLLSDVRFDGGYKFTNKSLATTFQRFVSMVRDGVRALGKTLGIDALDLKYNESDIRSMAARFLQGSNALGTDRSALGDRISQFKTFAADKFQAVFEMEQRGKVDEDSSFHGAMGAFKGRLAAAINSTEPMLQRMAKLASESGIDIKDYNQYLYSKHAIERNVEIINNSSNPKAVATATAMNLKLSKFVDGVEQTLGANGVAKLAESQTELKNMLSHVMKVAVDHGVYTQKEADLIMKYQNYVTMKKGDVFDSHGHLNVDVLSGPVKRITGEFTPENSDVIGSTLNTIRGIAVNVEKNFALQHLYDFAAKNPLMNEVTTAKFAKGEAIPDNAIGVRINGEQHHIIINDKPVLRALKGMDDKTVGQFMGALQKYNRLRIVADLALNPYFWVRNLIGRDTIFGAANLYTQDKIGNFTGTEMSGRALKSLPSAVKGLYDINFKGNSAEWGDIHKRYVASGAQMGLAYLGNDTSLHSTFAHEFNLNGKDARGSALRAARAVNTWAKRMNDISENAMRLSTFKHAIEAGLSDKAAARLAKDVAINFDRQGNAGQAMNALYLYSNAYIQGLSKTAEIIKKNPKQFAKIGAGLATLGFTSAFMQRAAFGDDYDKIPEHVRSGNLVMMTGLDNSVYGKIALPGELLPFFNAGQYIADMQAGRSVGGATMSLLSNIVQSLNPLGRVILDGERTLGQSAVHVATPSAFRPIVEGLIQTNEDGKHMKWSGTPMKPGTEAGYILESVLGGVGKFLGQTGRAATGNTKDLNDAPLVSGFVGEAPAYMQGQPHAKLYKEASSGYLSMFKRFEGLTTESARKEFLASTSKEDVELMRVAQEVDKQIRFIGSAKKKSDGNPETIQVADKEILKYQKHFLDLYKKAK